ncbi:MAG: DUF72 domain-containing protein [Candidatus Helarchaeota archaeon]
MKRIYFGCGGWSFFKAAGDPLTNYSKIFDFVEVNSTFYKIPDEKTCRNWKNKVKNNPDFIFSIKVPKEITHKNQLMPIDENFRVFDKVEKICKILNSNIIVFQTPPELKPNTPTLKKIEDFFSIINSENYNIIWETRGINWTKDYIIDNFRRLLLKYNITHCVDYFRSVPIYINSKIAYTRIFGAENGNQYQFDDYEITKLNNRFVRMADQAEKVIVSFHTQRMVHDAARAQEFNQTGKLISVSGKIGLESFVDAFQEYEKYPITKNELLSYHGWKIYDKKQNKRERMSIILSQINNKTYFNKIELLSELKKYF